MAADAPELRAARLRWGWTSAALGTLLAAAVLGATTNPQVLSALIHLVREAGASEIRVADNPIEAPESCFVRTGIRQASIDAGARVYLPTPSEFETLQVPGAKWMPFTWCSVDLCTVSCFRAPNQFRRDYFVTVK